MKPNLKTLMSGVLIASSLPMAVFSAEYKNETLKTNDEALIRSMGKYTEAMKKSPGKKLNREQFFGKVQSDIVTALTSQRKKAGEELRKASQPTLIESLTTSPVYLQRRNINPHTKQAPDEPTNEDSDLQAEVPLDSSTVPEVIDFSKKSLPVKAK